MKNFKYNDKCDVQKLVLFTQQHNEKLEFLMEYKGESGAEIIRNLVTQEYEKVQRNLKRK